MAKRSSKSVALKGIFVAQLFMCLQLTAQLSKQTDSLKQLVANAKTDTDRINNLLSLSKLYSCNDSTEKIKNAKDALSIAARVQWKKGMIGAYFAMGRTYRDCGRNYLQSIESYRQGVVLARASGDTADMAIGLVLMAQVYGALDQFVQKIDCYREVLTLNISPERRMGSLSNMGGAYAALGDYTAALNCYDSALRVFSALPKSEKRNTNDATLSQALLKMSTGDVYLSMSDYEHASHNYKSALALFDSAKSKYGVIIALTGIGKAYHLQHNDDKAIECYNSALAKTQSETDTNKYKEDRLIIYNLLGKLYLEQGLTSRALEYGQRSLHLLEDCPVNMQAPVTYNILGEIYTRIGQYKEAIMYLEKAIGICKKSGALDNEKDALQTLSMTYQQMGQPGKALAAYKNFIAVRDSVYSLDKAKEITRHELTADFTEKQAALTAEQDKKNAIQKAVMDLTIKKQHFAYVVFTVILLLLLVVGVLLYNRFKLREKLEMQMAITGERSRISSEMHDDLGSELSKISLLSEIVKDNFSGANSQSHLDNISKSSRELLDKMGEIVWSLNNKYDTLESLMIYIRRYAMEYFGSTNIRCTINMPDHFPAAVIEGELRRNIFLAVKEALHNVLKHSGGDMVTINVTIDERLINVNIRDNGVGIDEGTVSAFGNGLNNMKNRIMQVRGQFVIKNEKGTVLNFSFPLPN